MSIDRELVGIVLTGALAGQSYRAPAELISLINRDRLPDFKTTINPHYVAVSYTDFRYYKLAVGRRRFFGFWIPANWLYQLTPIEIDTRIMQILCEGFHRPITYYTEH